MKTVSKSPITSAGLIKDSVNGVEKYQRIPIRRRRTPLFAYELEGILYRYLTEDGVDEKAIREKAAELFANGENENAGLLLSALDFMDLFARIAIVDSQQSEGMCENDS